jgi:hypothetical protein
MAKDDARLVPKSEVAKYDAIAKEKEKISDPDGKKRKASDAKRDVDRKEFNAKKAQDEARQKAQIDQKVKAYEAKQAAARQAAAKAKPPIVTEGEAAKVNAGKTASFVEGRDAAAANAGKAQRVAAMKSANPPPAAATPRLGPPSGSSAASNSLALGGGSAPPNQLAIRPSGSSAASNSLALGGGSAPPNQLAIRPSGSLATNSPRISGPSPSRFGKVGANVGNMVLAAGANYAKRKIEEQDPSSIMGQAAQGVGLVGTGVVEGAALGKQLAGGLGAGVGAVVGGINAPAQYLLGKEGDRRVENIQHESRRQKMANHLARAADPLNAEDRRRRQADARQDYLESQPKYYDPNSGLSQDGLPSGRYLNAPDLSSLQGPAGQTGQAPEGQAPEGQAPEGQAPARQAPAASAQRQSDQFRRYHGTAFDPNSKLDRQKMQAMRGAGVQMDKSGMGPQAPTTRKTLTAANMYDNPNRKYSGGR